MAFERVRLRLPANNLEGALLPRLLEIAPTLVVADFEENRFSGQFPEEALSAMTMLKSLSITQKWLTGELPTNGLRRLSLLYEMWANENMLSGVLPEEGLSATTRLKHWDIHRNKFSGTLSEELLKTVPFRSSRGLGVTGNRFSGMLPAEGLANISPLNWVEVSYNRFSGIIPDEGFGRSIWLALVALSGNKFHGTLPEIGVSALTRLDSLHLDGNRFTGTIPWNGVTYAPKLVALNLGSNQFSGAVPWHVKMRKRMESVILSDNAHLQGQIPEAISSWDQIQYLFLGGTCMEGAIPRRLGAASPLHLSSISFRDLTLEGSLPVSLGRMPGEEQVKIMVILGYGVVGQLPQRLGGTLSVFSVFSNKLSGQLPKLRLHNASKVLTHSNMLSCRLPRATSPTTPQFSLVAVGNHFTEPRNSKDYPPWISKDERGEMFFVANRHGEWLMLKALFACCTFVSTLAIHVKLSPRGLRTSRLTWRGKRRLLRSLNACTQEGYACLAVASVATLVYLQTQRLTCTVVLARLQLPPGGTGATWPLVADLAFCRFIACMMLSFKAGSKHSRQGRRALQWLLQREDEKKVHWHHAILMLATWLLCSLVISVPGALYSLVKTVPGFLDMPTRATQLFSQSISVVSACLASVCLPYCTVNLHRFHREEHRINILELLNIGKLRLITPRTYQFQIDQHSELPHWGETACHGKVNQ